MAMALAAERVVQVKDIDKELGQLRRDMPHADGGPILPASVVNWLLVTEDGDAPLDVLSEVLGRQPGRVIVLSEGGAEGVEARVGALRPPVQEGERATYAETVVVRAGGSAAQYLPELALPLLPSAVPTILWWTGAQPLTHPHFARLAALVDRTLVDSERFAAPAEGLRALAKLAEEGGRWQGLGDLAWGRILPWRQLTAQFFDVRQARLALDRLDRVEIRYGSGRPPVQPALFAGWLASRLRWEPSSVLGGEGAGTAQYRHGAQRIELDIRPTDVWREMGGYLSQVRLSVTRGETAHFDVRRTDDGGCAQAEAQIGDGAPMTRVAELRHRTLARLLADEARLVQRDATYLAALIAAAQLA